LERALEPSPDQNNLRTGIENLGFRQDILSYKESIEIGFCLPWFLLKKNSRGSQAFRKKAVKLALF